MEYEKIKQLMEDMGNSKLTSISIEFPDGTRISMEKGEKKKEVIVKQEDVVQIENQEKTENIENIENIETKNENVKIVKSPMVGTFYSKSSPTAKPYVEIGTQVKVGETLCIIEAMKLMNEIESEFTGKIVKILVEDGKPVEYGTPLFEIEE